MSNDNDEKPFKNPYKTYTGMKVDITTNSDGSVQANVRVHNALERGWFAWEVYVDDRGSRHGSVYSLENRTAQDVILCDLVERRAHELYGMLQSYKMGGTK